MKQTYFNHDWLSVRGPLCFPMTLCPPSKPALHSISVIRIVLVKYCNIRWSYVQRSEELSRCMEGGKSNMYRDPGGFSSMKVFSETLDESLEAKFSVFKRLLCNKRCCCELCDSSGSLN